MVVFALLLSAFATPVATVVAVTSLETQLAGISCQSDSTTAGVSYTETDYNYVRCVLEATSSWWLLGKVLRCWQTSGVSDITINGEAVSQTSGTKTHYQLAAGVLSSHLKAINDAGLLMYSECCCNVFAARRTKDGELYLYQGREQITAVPW